MKHGLFVAVALAAFAAPAMAEQTAASDGRPKPRAISAKACLANLGHRNEDLAKLTITVRDRLIGNPGQIDAVVASAARANARDRTLIELGIVRSVEYLKCVDASGYQAITAYLGAHGDNKVVAEIAGALGSQASAGGAAASQGGGGQGGAGDAGGASGGGFAGSGATISQH